jgi:hypothetical protein
VVQLTLEREIFDADVLHDPIPDLLEAFLSQANTNQLLLLPPEKEVISRRRIWQIRGAGVAGSCWQASTSERWQGQEHYLNERTTP